MAPPPRASSEQASSAARMAVSRGRASSGSRVGIVDLSLGAIGAGDEIDADALGHEARDAAAGADALVVGMGVDEEDSAGLRRHLRKPPPRPMPANARRASRSPMAASSAMCPKCSAFAFPNRGAIRRSGASTTTGSAQRAASSPR